MKKRPLVAFSLSIIAGILCAYYSRSYFFITSLALLITIFFISFSRRLDIPAYVSAGVALFYLMGAFEFMLITGFNESKFKEFAGQQVVVRGFIASQAQIKGETARYIVKTREIEKNGANLKVMGKILLISLEREGKGFYEYGREVEINGRLNIPSGKRNPGGFDYKLYLMQSGISATIFAAPENIKQRERTDGNPIIGAGIAVRERIVRVINLSLPGAQQQAGLLNGMLIGYREGLSDNVREVFSDAGLFHIVAVSGANVAFITAPLVFIFKRIRLRKKIANIIIMIILVFFVFITGFEPSVIRAVIMAITMLFGQIIYRETDIFTSIAFSAIILLLFNPYTIFNIGFKLSFAATLSIVMFYKTIRKAFSTKYMPGGVLDAAAVTMAAQVGTLPISVFYFNKISIVSIISNVVVVPLTGIVTILGAVMATAGQISIFVSRLLGYVNCVLLSFILYVSKISSALPFAVLHIATPSFIIILTYYAAAWFLLRYKPMHDIRLGIKHCGVFAAVSAAVLCVILLSPSKLKIVFLDVGEGDSAFIRTCSGKTILIDGGGSADGRDSGDEIGDKVIIPFLFDQGVTRLDMVVATHGHEDHVEGLAAVVEDFKVDMLVIPDGENNAMLDRLAQKALDKKIPVSRCSRGNVIWLDQNTYFKVLHPPKGFYAYESSLNNSSLVLKLYFEEVSVLFTGDIEKGAEELMLADGVDIEADVLKVSHHGSKTSTSEAFLKQTDPKAAVVSTGTNNFGHPSAETLKRLEEYGTSIFRTDTDGAVIMETDGRRIFFKKMVGTR